MPNDARDMPKLPEEALNAPVLELLKASRNLVYTIERGVSEDDLPTSCPLCSIAFPAEAPRRHEEGCAVLRAKRAHRAFGPPTRRNA